MNNIIVQVVAISCCIFTVYTVLKSAYLGFQRMKKGQPSKSVVEESGHVSPWKKLSRYLMTMMQNTQKRITRRDFSKGFC